MPRRMSRMARMELMRPDRTREADARFRDRRGREHYDDGRFAPMRNDTNIEIEGRFRNDRGGERFENRRGSEMNYAAENRSYSRDDIGRFRSDYDHETYGPQNRMAREDWERRDGRMNYGENHSPYGPFPVYQERNGMRGGGYDMNQIGFDANREMDSNRYRMNVGYMAGRKEPGYASGAGMEPLTREKAEEWVRAMKGADGSKGQFWTMDQVKQLMSKHGFQGDPVEWYVAMNMMKRDYSKVANKMGVDRDEFYACMADAFLNDEDAQANKLARYYHCIAKKG